MKCHPKLNRNKPALGGGIRPTLAWAGCSRLHHIFGTSSFLCELFRAKPADFFLPK